MASLYLHIPFCSKRCTYCDFYFVTSRRDVGPFVRAMRAEIESYGRSLDGSVPIETIHFGGGTPSLLSLEEVARLMETCLAHFDCSDLKEVGFEANPESATREYLEGLRAIGVTRLSLGVQSFFDVDLAFMGRTHDAATSRRAVDAVGSVAFASRSLDLIFGVPEQPFEHWMANLERAVGSEFEHVSTYGLTIEDRTVLANQVARGIVTPEPDETFRDRYLATIEFLTRYGFRHYEVSNFARPGFHSRHNLAYWSHTDYLGFGPSAHSFRWESGGTASRWANVSNLRRYMALLEQGQRPIERHDALAMDELADEYLLLRLRLPEEGLDLDHFELRYGVDLLSDKVDELAEMERSGLALLRNGVLRLTPEGALLADAVTARLLADPTQ